MANNETGGLVSFNLLLGARHTCGVPKWPSAAMDDAQYDEFIGMYLVENQVGKLREDSFSDKAIPDNERPSLRMFNCHSK